MRAATMDKRTRASPTINKLIMHFEMSNLADGKSESTITWYSDILKLFSRYLEGNMRTNNLDGFNIENARKYVFIQRASLPFLGYLRELSCWVLASSIIICRFRPSA